MTVTTPNNIQVPKYPTWMTTIHNDAKRFCNILDFSRFAAEAGYPFICWNNLVYFCHQIGNDTGQFDNGGWNMATDTGWNRDDVDYFTHHHPHIERIHINPNTSE